MQHPTHAIVTTTGTQPAHLAAIAFLARYAAGTRDNYARSINLFFSWCEDKGLDPMTVTRIHLELFVRWLQDERHCKPATVKNKMAAIKGFYKFAVIDGVLDTDPSVHVLLPKVYSDNGRPGLDRNELGSFIAASRFIGPQHYALATMLGLLGLRVSEACSINIGDFDTYERGHRVIKVIGKGTKPATIPIPPMIGRPLDAARGDRASGPLLTRKKDGARLDRNTATCMVETIAKKAKIDKHVHPHMLRAAFITNALDAGVPLRDVQIAARHADPRTTTGYDRNRGDLDRHAVHVLAAYVAGAA